MAVKGRKVVLSQGWVAVPAAAVSASSASWAGLLALMSVVCGCSEAASSVEDFPPGSSGMLNDIFEDSGASSLEFLSGAQLTLVAGQTEELSVRVSPAGRHQVRFALLGDVQDAYLSADLVDTDEEGVARTRLTALAASAEFTVRAAAGRVDGSLLVSTQEANDATLIITASYPGSRATESWAASIHVNQTCSGLQGVPYPDGSVFTSSSTNIVTLRPVPADVPLAAVVRAGYFAGGCRSIPPLRANTETSFVIEVMERPMQTAGLSFQMAFGVEATEELNPALDALAFRAVRSMVGSANDDLAALLDAMSVLSSDPLAFEQARTAQSWRTALVSNLDADLPGTGLRTMVQDWMRVGLSRLEEPGAIQGTLTSLDAEGTASLALESVIGLTPEATGFERANAASARAETEDFLRIGATLAWRPSPLLSEAASFAALDQNPTQMSAAGAMAAQFGCGDVASVLVAAGATPGEAFDGCDEACVLALCEEAMQELWSRVTSSNLPAVPWQISGAARARIDINARPTSVSGDWVGSLTVSDFGVTPIQGPFSGVSSSD